MQQLILCCCSGILAGVVGGLLGLGGGFILGPLFLELGVPPQVLCNRLESMLACFVWMIKCHCTILMKNISLKIIYVPNMHIDLLQFVTSLVIE